MLWRGVDTRMPCRVPSASAPSSFTLSRTALECRRRSRDFSSKTELQSTLIKATRRRTFGYRPAVDRSSHRPSLCSSKQPCLERGLWSLERDPAALMRHSSPVRALHCTHAHGTGSSPVFPARLPASCRSTVAVGAPRRSRGCTWGSRIHIRIHSRAGQPGGWRAAACAVAHLHCTGRWRSPWTNRHRYRGPRGWGTPNRPPGQFR